MWLKKILFIKNEYNFELDELDEFDLKLNGNANKKSFNVSNENKYVVLDTNRILDSIRNKSKESTLKRMVKIIKKSASLFEQDRLQSKNDEKIYIEWREVARRLDIILFIISILVVELTPIYLFGKYFLRMDNFHYFKNQCGCEFSGQ